MDDDFVLLLIFAYVATLGGVAVYLVAWWLPAFETPAGSIFIPMTPAIVATAVMLVKRATTDAVDGD